MDKELFKKIGFNENKQNIYLALLSLGTATVTEVSKEAQVERTNVYKIVQELLKEDLIEELPGKVKKFVALPPSRLLDLLENSKKAGEALLPTLLTLFKSTKTKPKFRFYEGEDGFKKVFEDVLKLKNETIYTFSPVGVLLKRLGITYLRHYMEKRVKRSVKRLALRPAGDRKYQRKDWEVYAQDEKLDREVRFLPKTIVFNTLIQIYQDRVAVMASEKEGYSFIIESQELADLMKNIFKWLWKQSGKK